MEKVLVTGGTGHLGQWVVRYLLEAGHEVGVLSSGRKVQEKDFTLTRGDLASGKGLREAVSGVDAIVHCASNPPQATAVDVRGTKNLLDVIDTDILRHFVYISIVGVDKSDYPYYRAKYQVEQMLTDSKLPVTILRTTQFHSFVLSIIRSLPVDDAGTMTIPPAMKFQSVEIREVALRLVTCLSGKPSGLLPDFGGPEILSLEEMVKTYLEIAGLHTSLTVNPLENNRYSLFASGVNLCPDYKEGHIRWREFIQNPTPQF